MPLAEPEDHLGKVRGYEYHEERGDHEIYTKDVYGPLVEIVPVKTDGYGTDGTLVYDHAIVHGRFFKQSEHEPQEEDEDEKYLQLLQELYHLL